MRNQLETSSIVYQGGLPAPLKLISADEHPAAVYLARLSPGSLRTMISSLQVIAGLLTSGRSSMQNMDWGAIRYQHVQALRSILAQIYAPATANKILTALRGVLKEACRLGLMTAEEYHSAISVPPVKGETLPSGRALSQAELGKLFAACARDRTAAGVRDSAIIAVMYNCGLRRSELVALDLADFYREDRSITIRQGKGNKGRRTFLTVTSIDALDNWLHARGMAPGPLFTPVNRAGRIMFRSMTDRALWKILLKRTLNAGVDQFTPHDLRRTMISDLLDAGADISTVQRLAGHARVTTTQRYDRRTEKAMKKAADLLHVPYKADIDSAD